MYIKFDGFGGGGWSNTAVPGPTTTQEDANFTYIALNPVWGDTLAKEFAMEDFLSFVADNVKLPEMVKIRQEFPRPKIIDIEAEILKELINPDIISTIKPGARIAVTAGSRGITGIDVILKTIVAFVKERGASPFLFAAMGSHGGATAEGQREILESFGITEELVGAPVYCGTEVSQLCRLGDGTAVCIDKFAFEADGIILVNRIKPHTAFRNSYESGLLKMAVIGMGKQQGAEICHKKGWGFMAENIERIGRAVFNNANILFGVGILENAYDETYKIKALPKDEILLKEPELLNEARSLMPSIMFDKFDILVVDRIGKNISGDGMDPNITGVHFTPYNWGGPKKENVVVLDLTDESHGCAIGIGGASVTTKRFFDKIDFTKTYPNCLTSKVLDICKIPLVAPNDKAAVSAAAYACTQADRDNLKIVRIKDSLHVGEIHISTALFEEAKRNPHIKILGEAQEMDFDTEGNLFG